MPEVFSGIHSRGSSQIYTAVAALSERCRPATVRPCRRSCPRFPTRIRSTGMKISYALGRQSVPREGMAQLPTAGPCYAELT
jgi:hypothetical protein